MFAPIGMNCMLTGCGINSRLKWIVIDHSSLPYCICNSSEISSVLCTAFRRMWSSMLPFNALVYDFVKSR
jgi:hypothetical protein